MLQDAALADVHFVDAQHGWAVGDRGAIRHTGDGGRSWQLQRSGVDCRLESVHFIDRRAGWAVGGSIRPYSHRGEGVVLRTLDGGRRWSKVSGLTLPQLKSVKFFSPTRGWAVGSPSALFGGGVFHTSDGGRIWTPVDGPVEHWLCADFRDQGSGAIAGRHGQLSVVMTRGAIKSRTPSLGLRSIRDLTLSGQTGGWLVGDGGLVMQTSDGGLTWQLPPRAIPGAARHEIDFQAVTATGDHVWAVGSPGSIVLHSADAGRNWELQRTGQSLPLSAIHFVDAQTGWAAGAMGAILATSDGGQTWRRQHSGGTRAAIMFILVDERGLPLELVARLGGDEGYLCAAEVIGRHDIDAPMPLAASQEDCTTAAFISAGGSATSNSWQFPLQDKALQLSEDRIIKTWNRTHDGRAMAQLEAHLVRTIRTWRPDVIITHGEHAADRDERVLIGRMVRAAAKSAGDTTILPQQLTHAQLRPWQVKKVFTICDANEAGDVSVTASALAMRLGQSLADYTMTSRSLLQTEPTAPAPVIEFRLASHRVAQEAARRDFFSGIDLHPGGEARRNVGDVAPGNMDALRRLAQKRRHVQNLISQTGAVAVDDDAWLGQVNELTRGLSDAHAAQLVYQLAVRYSTSGRPDLAAETFQIILERYRSQPIAEQATVWLIQHYTSTEAAWRRRDLANPAAQPAVAKVPLSGQDDTHIARATFDEPIEPTATLHPQSPTAGKPRRQLSRAVALYKLLEQGDPIAAANGQLQLAIASAERIGGDTRRAESLYRQIAGARSTGTWGECAKAELWLRDPRAECPKPLAHCVRTSEKPFLDGRLNDAIWNKAQPITLRNRSTDDAIPLSTVLLAWDEEYLYLGVRSGRAAGADYVGGESPRERDDDLAAHDRIELLLDVNRDWNTAFRLTVDHRGWAGDAVAGDASWNPTWHIASAGDEREWTIEAAIPLAELGPAPPRARNVWAIGAQRIVPGVGLQSWSQPATAAGELSGLGMLLFQ